MFKGKATLSQIPSNVKAMAQINPAKPTGLEPAPKDYQYDVPA